MRKFRAGALLTLAVLLVGLGAYGVHSRWVVPQTAAREDSYRLWIALLKGFDGSVYYVGSDSTSVYFRTGHLFWSYYKLPSCAAQLPAVFPIGASEPYRVHFHIDAHNTIRIVKSCSPARDYELGRLDGERS